MLLHQRYSLNVKESDGGDQRNKEDMRRVETKSKSADMNPIKSITTLDANGSNSAIKREIIRWDKNKTQPYTVIGALSTQKYGQTESEEGENSVSHATTRALEQLYRKTRWTLKQEKQNKRDILMIKGSIHQKDTTIINIYAPNNRKPKHIKQKLTERRKKQTIQQ